MAALDLDFLTRVVNVNWETGLAVEFTNRPDYLTMNHALSMNEVVISFWFRVPKEAAQAVQARNDVLWEYRVFQDVIPLITWGDQPITPVTEVEFVDTGAIDTSATPIIIQQVSGSHTAPMQPSSIGVYVGTAMPSLDVRIQTNVNASGTGLAEIPTAFTGKFGGTDIHTGKPIYDNVEYIMTDVSYIKTEEPEYLGNTNVGGIPDVALDGWHHLLLSWELLPHSNSEGACKMWCALDDKNKVGFDLPAMCNPDLGMGPNDHVTGTVFDFKGNDSASVSINLKSDSVPSDPFQIPAPPSVKRASDDHGGSILIAPIEKVELAELQIFSGVTLDTSAEANRRAFIDFERDDDGNPIRDEHGKRTLKPVNPKQAEQLLGKRPAVLLHGTTEWQNGQNTGSLGINTEGEQIPSGQFKPTGEIKKYSPDPSFVES